MRVAAAGVAVLCGVIGVQWVRERAAVNGDTAELHAQAQKLSAQRVALTTQAAPLQALRAVAVFPDAPQLLAKLSAAVPNSAWFTHIDLATPVNAPGTLKLTGTVASEEEIAAALRAIPGVRNLRTSSAFSGEILGRERVEITAEFQAPDAQASAAQAPTAKAEAL
jgi:Tfp pilus assembly protein PilN